MTKPPSNAREMMLETQVFYAPAPSPDPKTAPVLRCAACKALLQVGAQVQQKFTCHTNSQSAYALCSRCGKKDDK